ncbi:MAG: DUF59 domain-containing protein [Candidatus Hydrogenedentota bacterium]|nr:MAG: DUF59 domain-containing protein [Candidatus Hydrogenedentota bacterium]
MEKTKGEGPAEGISNQGIPPHGKDAESAPVAKKEEVLDGIVAALRTCYDPEVPVNIYEMGLIYDVRVDEDGTARIVMTLTSPHCPVAESLPQEVQEKTRAVPGVKDVKLELVWDPPWNPGMMSEAARLELGFF